MATNVVAIDQAKLQRREYMKQYMRTYRADKKRQQLEAEGWTPPALPSLPVPVGDHRPASRVRAYAEKLSAVSGGAPHLDEQLVLREIARVMVALDDCREALMQVGPVEITRKGQSRESAWALRERALRRELIGLLREAFLTPRGAEERRLLHARLQRA